MSDERMAGSRWLVGTLVAIVSLFLGWKGHELNERRYQDEQREKSRPKMRIVHKGEGKVEITVDQIDPAGFQKSETFEWPEERWEKFYQELRQAPPPPRNLR